LGKEGEKMNKKDEKTMSALILNRAGHKVVHILDCKTPRHIRSSDQKGGSNPNLNRPSTTMIIPRSHGCHGEGARTQLVILSGSLLSLLLSVYEQGNVESITIGTEPFLKCRVQ
jgi:hypothetical protein